MAEALKCPNCGGNINRERMVCEYCGTQLAYANLSQRWIC